MLKQIKSVFLPFLLLLAAVRSDAQTLKVTEGGYTYETVVNDPLKTRIYTLDNGLKVYLSVNKAEPRIHTYIAIATGRKNDPPYAQGMSHYLEHMLFKGTDKFGTINYELEKPLIDSIRNLYNIRKNVTDREERKRLYRRIDSLSYLASEYAIPNEFDRMTAAIGASGVNAYTSLESTVYLCDIPSNQLDAWLKIEAERFRNPVMRLFHTELETVYEEKNMSLDDDGDKAFDALWAGLFKKHTYGTQTTLGSVEQLQNPSISEIEKYFYSRYVPGNMAIMLAGDFDPDQAIKLIDKRFGTYQAKEFEEFVPPVEEPIAVPEVITVFGPSEESVAFAYRTSGASTRESRMITLIEYILNNGSAGLMDLNLNQKQEVIGAYCYSMTMKDYSVITFGGKPRQGQSLEDVRDKIMSQIELVKKGEFPDWLIPAVLKNFKVAQLRSFENNSNRVSLFENSFILGIPWESYISAIDTLALITKDELVQFARENLNDNYVLVYKKTGEDPNVVKVEKPAITPVKVNRDTESEFFREVVSMPSEEIRPEFIDYQTLIKELRTSNGGRVFYLKNDENNLFEMRIVADYGAEHDRELPFAGEYLAYAGAGELSAEQLKEEFYKLASQYGNSVGRRRTTVSVSGPGESFEEALRLIEKLYTDPKGSEETLEKLVDDILKRRKDDKLSKETILWNAMYDYVRYGKKNPMTTRLSEKELRSWDSGRLLEKVRRLFDHPQTIYYYGPAGEEEVLSMLDRYHKTSANQITPEIKYSFPEKDIEGKEVYVVNYDMQQAEIVMLARGDRFDLKRSPEITLFNEYFGGNMSSIVFQDLRESKALAYAASVSYQTASEPDLHDYVTGYIGTQADKLPEAMREMTSLLRKMPESASSLENARASVVKNLQSDRITGSRILRSFENLRRFGIDYDTRRTVYEKIPGIDMNAVSKFHSDRIADENYAIMILGELNKLDMNVLKKYGEVKVLTLEEIFGY